MIRFAKAYLAEGGLLERVQTELFDDNAPSRTAIKRALDFVAENWQNTDTCDIWEEVHGDHFYTRMIQRRAMMEGQEFAMLMKDLKSADKYAAQVHQLTEALDGHWDERQSVILSARSSSRPNRSGLDSSVLFGVNHADEESGGSIESFAPNDPYVSIAVFQLAISLH